MTPVINPWVFYFMSVADGIGIFAFVASVVLAFIVALFFKRADDEKGFDQEAFDRYIKATKKAATAFAIAVFVAITVPSSETIMQMLVAQNVTYERVEAAGDIVQEVYEDIMGLFEDGEEE